MEVYLVDKEELVFKSNLPQGAYHDHINFPNQLLANTEIFQHFGIHILVGKSSSTELDPWISEIRFCSRVFPSLFDTLEPLDKQPLHRICTVSMTITRDEIVHHHPHCEQMENGWLHIKVSSLGKSSVFDLARANKDVKVGVELENLKSNLLESSVFLHAKKIEDLEIDRWYSKSDHGYRYGCTLPPIRLTGIQMSQLSETNQGPEFGGVISIYLVFNNAAITNVFTQNGLGDSGQLLKGMLEKEVGSDYELISSEKERFKCHRSVLSAASPVLSAMLEAREQQNGLQENAQNSAEVMDGNMSKEEVNAFLRYLYYGDLAKPLEDCRIALTLLKAGDYYQVPGLVKEMQDVLLIKSGLMRINKEWIVDVDTAVDLLIFGRRKKDEVDKGEWGSKVNWENLKTKALYILKWWAKRKPMELRASEKFKQMWRESDDFAEEMGTEFLQLS